MSKHKRILKHRSNVSLFSSIERKANQLRKEAKKCKPRLKVGKSRLVEAIVFKPTAKHVATADELERATWDAIANGKVAVRVEGGKVKYSNRLWHCHFRFESLDGTEVRKPVVINGKSEDDIMDKMTDYKVRAKVLGATSFQMVEPSGFKREVIHLKGPGAAWMS